MTPPPSPTTERLCEKYNELLGLITMHGSIGANLHEQLEVTTLHLKSCQKDDVSREWILPLKKLKNADDWKYAFDEDSTLPPKDRQLICDLLDSLERGNLDSEDHKELLVVLSKYRKAIGCDVPLIDRHGRECHGDQEGEWDFSRVIDAIRDANNARV